MAEGLSGRLVVVFSTALIIITGSPSNFTPPHSAARITMRSKHPCPTMPKDPGPRCIAIDGVDLTRPRWKVFDSEAPFDEFCYELPFKKAAAASNEHQLLQIVFIITRRPTYFTQPQSAARITMRSKPPQRVGFCAMPGLHFNRDVYVQHLVVLRSGVRLATPGAHRQC